jgi:type IV pilus assembly protein PilB
MFPEQLQLFREAINQPSGLILLTGPTLSGKKTDIYLALSEINRPDLAIATIEWVILRPLPGVTQMEVDCGAGVDFAPALRLYLDRDFNVIFVGELRDSETARPALRAAESGRLVISTMHVNDAAGAIGVLSSLGCGDYLLKDIVRLITAQRLLRRLCPDCREPDTVPVKALIQAGMDPESAARVRCFRGKGCPGCDHTGFKGLIGVFELFTISEGVRELIFESGFKKLKARAAAEGMMTLRQAALRRVAEGATTLHEAMLRTPRD